MFVKIGDLIERIKMKTLSPLADQTTRLVPSEKGSLIFIYAARFPISSILKRVYIYI